MKKVNFSSFFNRLVSSFSKDEIIEQESFITRGSDTDFDGKKFVNVVDQFPSQPFNLNENGFFRSDITTLQLTQDTQLYELIKSRLEELPETFSETDDVDEIVSTLKPRSVQDITEITKFNDYLGNLMYLKVDTKPVDVSSDDVKSEVKQESSPSE